MTGSLAIAAELRHWVTVCLSSVCDRFSGYDESAAELRRWMDEARGRVSQELELKATLDDKCDQLQAYRLLLHDLVSHQQVCEARVSLSLGIMKDLVVFA